VPAEAFPEDLEQERESTIKGYSSSYTVDFDMHPIEAKKNHLGEILRQRRVMTRLTLKELSSVTGVSVSHLGRIEQGNRFPSARVLHRIAKPLGLGEEELLSLAGYLSADSGAVVETKAQYDFSRLDPYVAKVLASEPTAVQFTVIGILAILKFLAKREQV